jgi:hypothetical protein
MQDSHSWLSTFDFYRQIAKFPREANIRTGHTDARPTEARRDSRCAAQPT